MFVSRIIFLAVAILITGSVWAKLPPPPVNQNLGMPDGTFSDMTFHTCLACHGDPENAPAPVKAGYLPDRHHLRVDTPIDAEFTASKYPEKSPDGTHKCITCHLIDWVEDVSRPLGGYFEFAEEPSSPQFRDCLTCHVQKKINGKLIATVHHLTDKAQRKLCHQCHGSLINDPTGGHRIPDANDEYRRCGQLYQGDDGDYYGVSMITPWPGDNYDNESWVPLLKTIFADCPDYGKQYYDPNEFDGDYNINPPRIRYEVNADNGRIEAIRVPDGEPGGRRTGNCEHCHFEGSNPGDAVQAGTGLAKSDIGTNMTNHHSTGVGQPGSGSVHTCSLCHAPYDPPNYTIRGCQVCHGISTLHSIEYDDVGDGIIAGTEKPFRGHIGNQMNCNGCHLNTGGGSLNRAFARSSGDPLSFGMTPSIREISTVGAIEGVATEVSIIGSSLHLDTTRIELTATDGEIIKIAMLENDFTTARTIIPDNIAADNYELTVAIGKEGTGARRSPSISFLVTRNTHINSASCDDSGMVTITGVGFGDTYVDGSDNLGLYDETNNFCAVESWSDIKIIANCSAGISNITVKGLFGEASSDVNCDDTGGGRPDWWGVWSWWSSWGWGGR